MRQLDQDEIRDLAGSYRRDGYAYARSMFSDNDLAPLIDAESFCCPPWTTVFGATAFLDPEADGIDQGYRTENLSAQ